MKNKIFLVILSLVIFLAAQTLGIAHAAAYGPGEHKHHGHVCDIYLSTDQAKSASLPPLPVLHAPGYSGVVFAPSVSMALLGEEYSSAFPRAPPATLLI